MNESTTNIANIKTIKDIQKIKYEYETFDSITIITKKIKAKGILRFAFKYAFWALKQNGILTIKDEKHQTYSFKLGRIDFWQIRNVFFKIIKKNYELVQIDESLGILVIKKIESNPLNTGISFGIVFSGKDTEEPTLINSINSILLNKIQSSQFEILIIGPSSYDEERIYSKFPSKTIKYLKMDIPEFPRLLFTKKKNRLLKEAKFNIVSINHTRILYPNDFFIKIISRQFDIITPKVVFKLDDGRFMNYLDYIFVGSYDTGYFPPKMTLVSEFFNDNYLYYFKKRYPTIDGGITIFNKNFIPESPYDENIAWGEAEDLDLCGFLFNQGYLLDYFYDIRCISTTSKLIRKRHFLRILSKFLFVIKKMLSKIDLL